MNSCIKEQNKTFINNLLWAIVLLPLPCIIKKIIKEKTSFTLFHSTTKLYRKYCCGGGARNYE